MRGARVLFSVAPAALVAALVLVLVPAVAQARGSARGAIARFLSHRAGSVSVAVDDLNSHRIYTVNGGFRGYTASIVKVDILETLLHREGALSGAQLGLAHAMIEFSDNGAASALWNQDGGGGGVGHYNGIAGLRCTRPGFGGFWGTTVTCARDQIRLLARLARRNRLLTNHARYYQLHLMRHVTPTQAWGVTGGIPPGVEVALKNGWLPSRATYNSIGWVSGRRRSYLIAVLTRSPSMGYGIGTIEGVSGIVWRHAALLPPHVRQPRPDGGA